MKKKTSDDAKHLNLTMPMYNLIERISSYFEKQEVHSFILKMKQLI